MAQHVAVLKNTYLDSVSLMSISTRANNLPGVTQAFVAMGTSMNKEVLENLGLLDEQLAAAGGGDLMVLLQTEKEEDLEDAKQGLQDLLERRDAPSESSEVTYRTLASAMENTADSNLVVISVNGAFAAREAEKALHAGKHVMMFSDNVSVEDELLLKQLAHEKGLLMMGPDCGTSIINGVGLCFANRVRRGNIGIVGASGTGSQELSVRIHDFGGGVSQLIGTGGRDLSKQIGGIMMIDGLNALAHDPETEVIVLVSKPPHPEIEKKVLQAAGSCGKPVIACFLGSETTESGYDNVQIVPATKPAALAAVLATGVREEDLDLHALNWPLIEEIRAKLGAKQRYIRALYCGGTLCDEAMYAALETYDDVYSNIQKDESKVLGPNDKSRAHTFLDMGDDAFTDGRPHPMIDPSLRNSRIVAEARDPEVGVILLDFTVGFGSHEDPVGVTLPAIKEAQKIAQDDGRELVILGYVLGTDLDEPNVQSQYQKLLDAGCIDASSSTNAGLLAREFVAKEA